MLARRVPLGPNGKPRFGGRPREVLTFPQPGNSQACTRLPFFALLIRPVGVQLGWPSSEMDEVRMVEVLSRREWEPNAMPSIGERGEFGTVGERLEATIGELIKRSFGLRRRSLVVEVEGETG